MPREQIDDAVGRFTDAARRAPAAGFEVAGIHGAHGRPRGPRPVGATG
ncbi:NADH:flavin oxidoreductase / NADH oxidase family protein [Streptomyces pini]|uniref:NADH:flavin oxidoreductase / NADH oxidase family protein n=1 Tax=Streptomyces pini TaxID=1520580 RepID=A0A1I4CQA0_9ACTN|nr:NADH:flavin oxidoreductase / NADH oxidase family protein [Streptomyces pini]